MTPEPDDRPAGDDARRSYAIVGTGAIGGYYGARLADAGHEVHFVARADLDHLRREGLRMESPTGDVSLRPVSVFGDPAEVPPVDVVVLATKTTEGVAAANQVRPLVESGSAVVVMQNGLGVEEEVARVLPGATVLGAMCFICSNRVGPGHIRHLDYGKVTIGEHGADAVTPLAAGVAADLAAAGVSTETLDDLVTGRWRKLVWNIPFNGLSVVLDAGTDELMADPAARAVVRALMIEVAEAAAACGHAFDVAHVDDMLTTTDAMQPYATSMKLDHEAGRPLEIDAIYAAPRRAAAASGYDMVRTGFLEAQLRFLDARTRTRRA
jgi:2-dehydropantoate 2-reductase